MVYGCCKKCLLECIGDGDHRPYLLSFAKIGSSRICVQKHFEHELECSKVCLDIINVNIVLCDLDSKSSNYVYSGLQLP
jgi:hypothetical protein